MSQSLPAHSTNRQLTVTIFSPGVLKAISNLFTKATDRWNEDLRNAYPEPHGLSFLNPEPLGDVEAHLKASRLYFALKADAFLVKIADILALLARPITDGLSYLAEVEESIDPKIMAERLCDASKALINSIRLTETARMELVCSAFKVPVSAAKTERGHSLLGHAFAKNVDRLRKDKKVLLAETAPGPSTTTQRQPGRYQDRATARRTNWQNRRYTPYGGSQSRNAPQSNPSTSGNRQAAGPQNNANNGQTAGTPFPSITDRIHTWHNITSDRWILDTVAGYRIPFSLPPTRRTPPRPVHFSEADAATVDALLAELRLKHAITPIPCGQAAFISNLFLVAKKGSASFRPVINLKSLNRHIPYTKFKMEGWLEIREAIFPNCYFARIDLKDAFLSVTMHPDSQPFLTFLWRGYSYCWSRLPFGLKTSPRVFTKLMKPVFAHLRQAGITLIVYLDDFLLISDSSDTLTSQVKHTTDLLTALGYTVNFEKSSLTPTRQITFLGFVIDSVTMRLSTPDEKLQQIKALLASITAHNRVSLRDLSRALGKLNSLCTIVRSIRYHCHSITQVVSHAARGTTDFSSLISVTPEMRQDLLWSYNNINSLAQGPIHPPLVSKQITSDSSSKGWGAWSDDDSTGGSWNETDRQLHINALELKAILLAVKNLAAHLSDTSIAIRTDNTTAMHCINNFGSLRSPTLNALARELWSWAFDHKIFLKATYLPGAQNSLADSLSRTVWDNHSYSLLPAVFSNILNTHGPFDIDLFADFTNYKVATYLSWQKDPFAFGIDAFTYRWDTWHNLYAFPPFKLIDRCLTYFDSFTSAELSLISPLWPTQSSFPRLLKRCVDYPRQLPPCEDLLLNRQGEPHPLLQAGKLTLVLWRLAPLTCREKHLAFYRTLSARQRERHTEHVGIIGNVGVRNDTPLPLLPL